MGSLVATVACLLAYPGCGAEPPPPPTVPAEKFSVTYERSGGLKPTSQRLVIRPGGQATATTQSGSSERTVRFRVPLRKINQLRAGLSNPHFAAFESGEPGNCADCYLYSIDYRGHTVSVTDGEVPGWLSKTIGRLGALAAHRPFH